MNQQTCSDLTAVFPLILITVVLERARVSVKIRKIAWFRRLVITTVGVSLVGTLVSLIGVQTAGLGALAGSAEWCLVVVGILGLGLTALMIIATDEVVEDRQ